MYKEYPANLFRISGRMLITYIYIFSVRVSMSGGDYVLSEGGLGDKFKPIHYQFHWGSDDVWGAEHAIDGVTGPLEVD